MAPFLIQVNLHLFLLLMDLLLLGNQQIRGKKKDIKRVFKEEWVAQFPWAKPIVDLISKIYMVHCKICSLVEDLSPFWTTNPRFLSMWLLLIISVRCQFFWTLKGLLMEVCLITSLSWLCTFLLFLVGCQKLTLLTRWYVLGLMV